MLKCCSSHTNVHTTEVNIKYGRTVDAPTHLTFRTFFCDTVNCLIQWSVKGGGTPLWREPDRPGIQVPLQGLKKTWEKLKRHWKIQVTVLSSVVAMCNETSPFKLYIVGRFLLVNISTMKYSKMCNFSIVISNSWE